MWTTGLVKGAAKISSSASDTEPPHYRVAEAVRFSVRGCLRGGSSGLFWAGSSGGIRGSCCGTTDRDDSKDAEEHGVAGNLEAEVDEFLEADCDQARDGARADPVRHRVVLPRGQPARRRPAIAQRFRARPHAPPLTCHLLYARQATLQFFDPAEIGEGAGTDGSFVSAVTCS